MQGGAPQTQPDLQTRAARVPWRGAPSDRQTRGSRSVRPRRAPAGCARASRSGTGSAPSRARE
eukprot:scaffold50572_cov242-Isochrysis_galbana.AAC.2